MLFNSLEFIAFLFIVLAVYSISPMIFRRYILLVSSLYFYASWNAAYLVLIIFVVLATFYAGLVVEKGVHRAKFISYGAILLSLGILGVFKYGNFLIDNMNFLLNVFSKDLQIGGLSVLLPVGISFYTFQGISYVIDVKRGMPCERNLIDYSVYITFFPQLVAGPIERASNILPQVKNNLVPKTENLLPGFTLLLTGFFKKLVIADRLSGLVDVVYSNPGSATPEMSLLAMYFFAFQIYCDFSGYTDIARGVAKFFNVNLMENFNKPYFSTSVRDFWRRWHISLSTWFRDYLYIPLGGSRRSRARVVFNYFVVFSLCGLWHGAAYTFIIWGTLHGVFLAAQYLWSNAFSKNKSKGRNVFIEAVCIVLTFHIICLMWVFFRAESLGDAFSVFNSLTIVPDLGVLKGILVDNYEYLLGVIFIGVLLLFEAVPLKRILQARMSFRIPAEIAFHFVLFYVVLVFGVFDLKTFIYFQF